ncbi:hypothetical protein LTR86_000298 [Recurvomyces mirabilis]|nr:hypothetical protein LTR86_000298 [Recurvomyces mirabilis]
MAAATLLQIAAGAALAQARPSQTLDRRLNNGLALKPPMGWDSYNHYACIPNSSIVESNAKALVDLGLSDLGYHYVVTDCGWTVPDRTANGTLTWNETSFPDGFPAMGEYIHSLGLGFGAYSDAGIQMCMNGLPNQTGSLYHESMDAQTFASWGVDLLKYDNCYSDKDAGYPDADYNPSSPLASRFETMKDALEKTGRDVLYQVCEWGLDFPSAWAPAVGNTWRITNDIIPAWRTIWRQINQFVPSASYAGPGQWPDLDMLEVGNDIFTEAEEQTHFTLWAIAKSPLVIGCALNDTMTHVNPSSLAILKNADVIASNQDELGIAANLSRRYSDAGLDIWSGPLSGGRTIAALVNWNNNSVDAALTFPDIGLQSAGTVKNIWSNTSAANVVTSYPAQIPPHGTLLLELSDTTPSGVYKADRCARLHDSGATFSNVSGITDSAAYTLTIHAQSRPGHSELEVSTSAASAKTKVLLLGGSAIIPITLSAGMNNTVTISGSNEIFSIHISPPQATFYPSTAFTASGIASHYNCTPGLCAPVGSKITNLAQNGSASLSIQRTSHAITGSRYVEITYINNDVATATSWGYGTNTRNITVAVNGVAPVRLEAPLSGRSSELFSPMRGWGDPATLGVLVSGFGDGKGEDTIVVGNANGDAGYQAYGADFVGLRIF